MSTARRFAFLLRVTWNHSITGYLIREFGIVFARGGWVLIAYVVFVKLMMGVKDPMEAEYPKLVELAKGLLAAIATLALWGFVDVIKSARRYGYHLPGAED